MASWGNNTREPDSLPKWQAIAIVLVLVACYLVAARVEGGSLDPNTGCAYSEHLTAQGTCR